MSAPLPFLSASKAMPQCKTEEPIWKEVASGHVTACYIY
jgi:hypothetical protein